LPDGILGRELKPNLTFARRRPLADHPAEAMGEGVALQRCGAPLAGLGGAAAFQRCIYPLPHRLSAWPFPHKPAD